MGSALKIRDDLTPLELRRWACVGSYRAAARGTVDAAAAGRGYGIANALTRSGAGGGCRRLADAARLAGMDRQTLRDAVVRYNAKGLEGLHDRPKGWTSPRRLTADEEAALAAVIIAGPEPERDGVFCAWTRADLCRWLEERFAKTYHPSSMTRVLRSGWDFPARRRARATREPGFYGGWDFPARRRARATREGTPKRRSASKKGASRHPEGDRRGASRQAPTAVVSG